MSQLPLEGIRVLDLGTMWAMPLATRQLAFLGAEVITIESCKRINLTRFGTHVENDPAGQYWNTSGRFNSVCLNKRGITLDLSIGEGREIFKKLVKISDVVTENYAPRVMKNLGLDYAILKELNPGIIMVSSSGFGHTGPWKDYRSYAMNLGPLAGYSELTGYPGGAPIKFHGMAADVDAALHASLAILAALEYRRRTGKGQWVDLAQYETAIQYLGGPIIDYVVNGRLQARMGNRSTCMVPHGCYRCQGDDKWVVIAVSSEAEWIRLCQAMGNPSLAGGEKFRDVASRRQNQDELDKLIEAWTITQNHYEVMHVLQKAGIPAGAVLNAKELLLDPHLKERGYFQRVVHPKLEGLEHLGTRIYPGLPWETSRASVGPLKPAPTLGQDNEYVLAGLLGMSDEKINELRQQGVIGNEPEGLAPAATPLVLPLAQQKEEGTIQEYDENYKEILGL